MSNKKKITKCDIRMYTMGTGDCFVLSFKSDNNTTRFKLMIDCGVYQIKGEDMEIYAQNIIDHTGGEVDALLITHEHQDHVLGFQRAEKLFTDNFKIKELWLPWTEKDSDKRVKDWKDEYGKKKKALAVAAAHLAVKIKEPLYNSIYNDGTTRGKKSMAIRQNFSETLDELSALNTEPLLGAAGEYVGGLKGMEIVKDKLKLPREKEEPRYLETGSVIENIEGLDNIRIYILGPPEKWINVKEEHGKDGETYKHNKELEIVRGFSSLPFEEDDYNTCPFYGRHIVDFSKIEKKDDQDLLIKSNYEKTENTYRRIDYDWLLSAANLSLRLTRGINNLSAVLAIEFVDSGKVMLFPGDAEIGSWKSWHEINWNEKGKDGETHLTTDLLRRTVFYKVAHHMSHNGTAKEIGIDLMTDKELVAMATLDYSVISKNWRNTMPNRGLVKDLLNKTKGRLIMLNPEGIPFDKAKTKKLINEIDKRRENLGTRKRKEFEDQVIRVKNPEYKEDSKDFKRKYLYVEYTVDGK